LGLSLVPQHVAEHHYGHSREQKQRRDGNLKFAQFHVHPIVRHGEKAEIVYRNQNWVYEVLAKAQTLVLVRAQGKGQRFED
jgi:hypothetical protein